MRTILSSLLILFLSFGLTINEASAKRFGGGKSFGVQRSQSSLFNQNKSSNTAALGQKPGTSSKWGGMMGGMLGGLLIGGLLTSLFMGNGLGTGLITWLILGAALFFLISFVRKRMQPAAYQSAQGSPYAQNTNPLSNFTQAFTNNGSSGGSSASDGPEGFNADAFLRQAKVLFIRMQTAYDQKNIEDLKAFTAPEIFAEIQMQLDERGNAANKTEVFNLEAELLDASKQSYSTIASVRFTGTVKENEDPVAPLDEIWHFRQFEANGEWVVGGIQQEVVQPS